MDNQSRHLRKPPGWTLVKGIAAVSLWLGLCLPTAVFTVRSSVATARSAGSSPVVSDLRPYSFTVSWATPSPVRAAVQIQVAGKWRSVSDVRGGKVYSTTHLFEVPCNLAIPRCPRYLTANTSYAVRVYGVGRKAVTLHVRTTPLLPPGTPAAAVGGHVVGANRKPVEGALVYVIVRQGKSSSVPLAVLTQRNGAWLVSLANAVTAGRQPYPLQAGARISIRVLTGRAGGSETVTLKSMDQPLLLGTPLVIR